MHVVLPPLMSTYQFKSYTEGFHVVLSPLLPKGGTNKAMCVSGGLVLTTKPQTRRSTGKVQEFT
jgi:hypothetical protein